MRRVLVYSLNQNPIKAVNMHAAHRDIAHVAARGSFN